MQHALLSPRETGQMTNLSPGDLGPYTPAAREVVESAPVHAAALGHDGADTPHLLLGLVTGGGTGMAAVILRELPVEPTTIQRGIEERLGLGDRLAGEPAPFSDAARPALDLALRENLVAGPGRIGTDHVLLGLLAEGGFAAEILAAHGVTAERFRAVRDRVWPRQCYGCVENATRAQFPKSQASTLPDDLNGLIERVGELGRAKEEAIDAEDYERAANIRDEEKSVFRRAVAELDERTAKAHLTAALDEITWLRTEVGKLSGLLHHRHGADGENG